MIARLETLVFARRRAVVSIFVVVTVLLAVSATRLQVDAGFLKLLPLKHEYMKVFVKYRDTFGGANRIVVALTVKQGDIYTPRFFATLREATDEVFFLPGVPREMRRMLEESVLPLIKKEHPDTELVRTVELKIFGKTEAYCDQALTNLIKEENEIALPFCPTTRKSRSSSPCVEKTRNTLKRN